MAETFSISKDEVDQYIREANEGEEYYGLERSVLMYAGGLAYITGAEPLPDDDYLPERLRPGVIWGNSGPPITLWTNLVSDELAEAFCKRSARYRHEVSELASGSKLLIVAVAGYIAGHIGIAVGVIAALVAALLRVVSMMGVSVFCKHWQASKHKQKEPQTNV